MVHPVVQMDERVTNGLMKCLKVCLQLYYDFYCNFFFQLYYNFVSTLSRINRFKFDNKEIVRLVGNM